MSKRDITDAAKQLIASDPMAARNAYVKAWKEYPDEFNDWDAMFFFQAIRKCGEGLEELEQNIFEKFNSSERVKGMYSWVLFDRYVKNFDDSKLNMLEPGIIRLTEVVDQKDMTNPTDSFPCPYTIGVNKIIKAYKKPNFNIQKISFWINKLDESKLSRTPSKRHDEIKNIDVEMASDYESFLATKAKLLERSEEFNECIVICDRALAEISNMHHDNNIWFVRLKALSLINLDRSDEGEALLESILKERKGQKWFIKKELAEVYNDHGEYNKALSYAIDAAMTGQDFELKTDLFLFLARLYFRLDKTDESLSHAKLLLSISQKEERRVKADHNNLYRHFNLDTSTILDFSQCLRNCKQIWETERFAGLTKESGRISVIHANGRSGIIISTENSKRFFSMREITNKKKSDSDFTNYEVEYFLKEGTNKQGEKDFHATSVKIVQRPKNTATNPQLGIKVGEIFEGTIDNIADFGLFIKFNGSKGLLHRSNLPQSKNEKLIDFYSVGQKLKIKIKNITSKGIDLTMAN